MRRLWLSAAIAAGALVAARDARGQSDIVWRNYEPEPRVFARDSIACRAQAVQGTDSVLTPDKPSVLGKCAIALGWRPMQRVAMAPGNRCDAAVVAGTGPDTSLAAALRESFGRRFRPASADVPRTHYEIRVASTGLSGVAPAAGATDRTGSPLPPFLRDVEYDIAPRLMTLPAGAGQGYHVTLRARCVSEFPYSAEEMAALSAPGSSPMYFEFQVEKQAIGTPGTRVPDYPRALRDANIQGEVLAQFIVDRRGRAEPGTLKILITTHEAFTEAVRKALPNMRFLPAEIHGKTVRQLVQQPFAFAIAR